MKYTAYLMVLKREEHPVDTKHIHEELLQVRFNEVLSFGKYTPDSYGSFVVWRYHRDDKLTDEAAQKLVGKNKSICYVWLCPRCGKRVSKTEFPFNHDKDTQFGCNCPSTAWGYIIC